MLSVFRRPSTTHCLALAKSVFALPAHNTKYNSNNLRNTAHNHVGLRRCFASKPKQGASTYTAAVLEEFDQPLVLAKMTNDTPLGTDMVRIYYI